MLRKTTKAFLVAEVLWAIWCIAVGSVQSQEPTPSPTISSQQHKAEGARPQQPTDSDQRGTEQAPFFVKIIPTPKTDEEAAAEANDRNEKTTNDRELIAYSKDLDIV